MMLMMRMMMMMLMMRLMLRTMMSMATMTMMMWQVNALDGTVIEGWVKRQGYHPDQGWSPEWWYTPWLDAYYYAITTLTTVGYGDRTAYTDREKVFSIVTELAGGIIFGMLAGTLSSMVTEDNASQVITYSQPASQPASQPVSRPASRPRACGTQPL
jgi:hypothetical protein